MYFLDKKADVSRKKVIALHLRAFEGKTPYLLRNIVFLKKTVSVKGKTTRQMTKNNFQIIVLYCIITNLLGVGISKII